MDDHRLGGALRLVRQRRGWRQTDLAAGARCSRTTVSRLERGHLDSLSVAEVRRIGGALDVRLELTARWRGGDLDRLVNGRHGAMHEAVARYFRSMPGWSFHPEVSFSIYGERGVIDILAWHAARAMVLVVELKTELVDVQALIGTMDRRRRLALRVAELRGLEATAVSSLVLLAEGRTNRRHLATHRTVLRTAFPTDGRRLAGWLREPREPVSMLAMWPDSHPGNVRTSLTAVRRVRVRAEGPG